MEERTDRPFQAEDCGAPMQMANRVTADKAVCEKRNPARTKELLGIAESIASIVEAQTRRSERCRLRRMVEMLLEID